MNLLSNLGWRKISSLWCSKYWKMHLQVRILNLDIFIYVPLQTKISSKFLLSPSGSIQTHMTAIKHKKSQVIYTYELTNKQIFICKVMFFYEVCFLMFFLWSFFLFLFVLPATMLIQFFTSLDSAGEQFRNNSPSEEKLNLWENLLPKMFIKRYSFNIQWYIFSKMDNKINCL